VSLIVQDAPDYVGLADVRIIAQIEALEVTGSITVSSGNVEITGPLTAEGNIPIAIQESIELDVNITNSVVNIQGTVVVSSGSVEISGPLSAGGNVNVAVQESVQIDVNVTNSTLTITGSVTVSSGSVEISGPLTTEGNVSVAINQSIQLDVNVTNSVINIQGSVDANITNATLTIEGDVNVTNSVLSVNITNEVLQSKLAKSALAFNGENAYVRVEDSPSLTFTDKLTIFAVIKPYSFSDINGRAPNIVGRENEEFRFRINTDGRYWLLVNDGTGFEEYTFNTKALLNEWQTAAITFNAGLAKLYFNGEFKEDHTFTKTSIADSNKPVWVGTFTEVREFWNGLISQVLLYNRDLSADEIRQLHENPQSPPTNGLVLWLNFDEGSGDIAYDKSGNGNHGTIYNAVWVSEQGQVAPLLAVNIAAKQVTLDINITAQDVDVKIYTPSGRWTTVSELVTSSYTWVSLAVSPGEEKTAFSLTGRGRLITLGFYFTGSSANYDAYNKPWIKIYVDGETSPSISLSPVDIDHLSGWVLEGAMTRGFNRVDYGTAGQAAYATALNPVGGLTWMYKDSSTDKVTQVGGFIRLAVEFMSSLDVKIYNSDAADTLYVSAAVFYGEYP